MQYNSRYSFLDMSDNPTKKYSEQQLASAEEVVNWDTKNWQKKNVGSKTFIFYITIHV